MNKNITVDDLTTFLENINYVLDLNTEQSREFVRNLRFCILKFNKNNSMTPGLRTKIRAEIDNIKIDKIKKFFMNKMI